ncbi:nicotinate-nucleotide adenylyltransferase [Crocinitomix catalasitica]|nr:nicotinate-nucleotide adenylyltransferase [Crocinitomix catalasitica]
MNKVGLYFGSYNPIHNGHIKIANYFVSLTDIDEVWFVVSPQNPLKAEDNLINEQHRLNMVRDALEDHEKLRASDLEFELPKPSYTIATLNELTKRFDDRLFHIIMGEDNLRGLHLWKEYQKILDDYIIYVYPRLPDPRQELPERELMALDNIRYQKHAPVLDISSTSIRRALKKNENISSFVPEKVFDYIKTVNLYS